MHGQEILIVAEYLRLKQFKYAFRCFVLGCDSSDVLLAHSTLQVSQAVTVDYPDLKLTAGLEIIAGLLYVPLSTGGRDFIAFLRKGQPRQVNWAGRPQKSSESQNVLEPRASFKIWSETVAGRCRAWTDEHLETAGVLALVYPISDPITLPVIRACVDKHSHVPRQKLGDVFLGWMGKFVKVISKETTDGGRAGRKIIGRRNS